MFKTLTDLVKTLTVPVPYGVNHKVNNMPFAVRVWGRGVPVPYGVNHKVNKNKRYGKELKMVPVPYGVNHKVNNLKYTKDYVIAKFPSPMG